MIGNLFSKSQLPLKKVALTDLVSILQQVCQKSFITRSEKSSSYDFDRSLPFLTENDLEKHISFTRKTLKTLPLNSERHLYEINNIIIRYLHIDLNNRSTWDAYDDWEPLSHAKWHFENCYFDASGSNMYAINFPWSGSFRFYKNKFDFQTAGFGGYWLFVFQKSSRIWMQRNNFRNDHVQTRCVPPKLEPDDSERTGSEVRDSATISFIGNWAISSLDILEGYASVSFTGMNQIESLWFMKISDATNHDDATHGQEPVVYFGPREKIDRYFHHCLQHRSMFLYLRRLAATSHDTRQLRVLDKQIDRIEYFLNKEQDTPSLVDFRIWIEYWQDRLLYAWRRWSSDFYRSWMRPLLLIISGYMLMNAVPAFIIESFSLSHWIELTLRPIGEIANFEQSLNTIVGDDYNRLSSFKKMSFKLIGLIQVIWIAMWSFAFARSIKR